MQMSKIHCVKQDVYMTLQTPEKDQKFCPLGRQDSGLQD